MTKKLVLVLLILISFPSLTFAKVETFSAQGEYTISKNDTLQQAEDGAFAEAIRSISEQAGILVSSDTRVKNATVTQDEIRTATKSIIQIIEKKYERSVTESGDIHITAYVKANVDPDLVIQELQAKKNDHKKNPTTNQFTKNNDEITNENIPIEYVNALAMAKRYMDPLGFSKLGLYYQLSSQYGSGFNEDAAKYAINHIDINWNESALARANKYAQTAYMSKKFIYKQLIFEKFTDKEAKYAFNNVQADWNQNALGKAKQYQFLGLSRSQISRQLNYEGFQKSEIKYAMDNLPK